MTTNQSLVPVQNVRGIFSYDVRHVMFVFISIFIFIVHSVCMHHRDKVQLGARCAVWLDRLGHCLPELRPLTCMRRYDCAGWRQIGHLLDRTRRSAAHAAHKHMCLQGSTVVSRASVMQITHSAPSASAPPATAPGAVLAAPPEGAPLPSVPPMPSMP